MNIITITGIDYPSIRITDYALRRRGILVNASKCIESVNSDKTAKTAIRCAAELEKLASECDTDAKSQVEFLRAIIRRVEEARVGFTKSIREESERVQSLVGAFNAAQEELERKQLESGVEK